MSWGRRFGIIAVLGLIVVALGGLVAITLDGLSPHWRSLGQPPENAVAIASVNGGLWVITASGSVYKHDSDSSAWYASDPPPADTPAPYDYLPLTNCGTLPTVPDAVDLQAVCRSWGPGSSLTVYVIRPNGEVVSWQRNHGGGEFLGVVAIPILGIALFCAFIAVLVLATRPHKLLP